MAEQGVNGKKPRRPRDPGSGKAYVGGPASGIPARGYKWEPFRPGNTVAQTHGAGDQASRPTRATLELAAIIAERLLDGECPQHLLDPKFRPAVLSWARREARATQFSDWLDQMDGPEEMATPRRSGQIKSPFELWLSAEHSAAKARKDLGLDMASYASVMKDLGIAGRMQDDAIERLGVQGTQIRQRREATVTVLKPPPDDDGDAG
jgi:hypothetical protein